MKVADDQRMSARKAALSVSLKNEYDLPMSSPYSRLAEGIYRRGNKRLYLIFTHRGVAVREKLAVTSVSAAKEIRDGTRANIDRRVTGQSPVPIAQSVRQVLAARLLDREKQISPRTYVRYQEIEVHLNRLLGDLDVRLLESKDLRAYQKQRIDEKAKAKTVNNELQLLHSAILSYEGPDVFKRKEFRDGWKLPEPDPDEYVVFMDAEAIQKVLRAAGAEWFRRFIVSALWLGCRAGELASLRKADVDLKNNLVTFRGSTVKGKQGKRRSRRVPLLLPVREALIEQIASTRSTVVFPSPRNVDEPVAVATVTEAWAKARKRAGVKARFHDLRHTAVSRMLEIGLDSRLIREVTGHADTRMIDKVYGHVRPTALAAALRKLETDFHPSFTPALEGESEDQRKPLN